MKLLLLLILAAVAFGFVLIQPRASDATGTPVAPLLSCPNVDGSMEDGTGGVRIADILAVVKAFHHDWPATNYSPLYDLVAPYNSTDGTGGQERVADILNVVDHFHDTCPLVDTQVAQATRAIGDPTFSSILCDDAGAVKYLTAVNCGGDPQFLTANASFLLSRGYRSTGADVPGQGVHYANFPLLDGVFNPARPEGLVYKRIGPEDPGASQGSCYDHVDNGGDLLTDAADPDCFLRLVAQLYYGEGDLIGWGPDRDHNVGAVNTDSFPCSIAQGSPPGVGCGWDSSIDGWHWHKDLCTIGIGTNPQLNRMATQTDCATWGATLGITCTFPPTPNFTCKWDAAVGWMGHLWNWLPNANYTNAVNPNTLNCTIGQVWPACGECGGGYCTAGESNGRFADCFPDVQGWNAYNCPQ